MLLILLLTAAVVNASWAGISADNGISYLDEDPNEPEPEVAGFEYTDYDTSKPGDYTKSGGLGCRHLQRNVYQNQTFTNKLLPKGRNALFKNCKFEGVFFAEADSHVGWASQGSNVRFEDCNFNGVIVTSVPDDFYGPGNSLYFTGSSLFNNTYMEEATILAPNFNVDIGNNRELEDESESVLTGLVVGGIVDVRGNANIDGTILSMYKPAGGWTSGVYASYATNVGFSSENPFESGVPEDAGTIYIHPNPSRMLPLGMKSNITIDPNQESYTEH